jgi:hypothetical protein
MQIAYFFKTQRSPLKAALSNAHVMPDKTTEIGGNILDHTLTLL